MKTIDMNDIEMISGGHRNRNNAFYQNVVRPMIQGAGGVFVGGAGAAPLLGVAAASTALYAVEQVAPQIPQFLTDINRLSDAEIQNRLNNPYQYAD